ncbi:O-antigen polymerase, partial [Vibrio splendidus]
IGILSNHISTVFNISNISQILVLANQNAISRYDSTLNVSVFYKISTIFSFLCALLLGTFSAVKKNNLSKLLTVAFFSILFLDSILMAARAGLLLQLSAFLSSYLLAKYVTHEKGFYSISAPKVIFVIVFFSIIYAFFVLVQVARGGKDDFDLLSISSHVLTWFVGYLSAFDIWIKDYYNFEHSFGLRTFSGLADALNISQRSGGVYTPVEVKDGRVTNVYTAYRGLIEDFSLPFSIVIMTSLGVVISKGVNELIFTRNSFYYSIVVMVIYFILWSFVINPYIYNTVLLAMIMFFVFNNKYVVFKKYD